MLINEIEQITSERGRDYDHPLPNFLRISLAWSIEDSPFLHNPIGVASKMVLLKNMRSIKTPKWDNYRDTMGYVNTIDMMCKLYFELTFPANSHSTKKYSDCNDVDKDILVDQLRNLTFAQQYELLQKCMAR